MDIVKKGKLRISSFNSGNSRSMRVLLCLILFVFFLVNLPAQIFEHEDDAFLDDNDIIRGEKKSAATAIIMSSIFPGSGHFYVNRRSWGTFVFPIVEIALWVGYFHYDNKGSDIEKDYWAFADKHYRRERQTTAQNNLINNSQSSSIYTDEHFRLDDHNTQHYYEDIGKYNKYIFGWEDWYEDYYEYGVEWRFDDNGVWIGNYPTHPDYDGPEGYHEPRSDLRQKYIGMRRDAQENFDNRVLTTFGMAFNRIASALDVIRVTTSHNRERRYASNIDFGLQPVFVNNQLTPTLNASINF